LTVLRFGAGQAGKQPVGHHAGPSAPPCQQHPPLPAAVTVRPCLKATGLSNFQILDADHRKIAGPWDKRPAARGELSLSDTSSVLLFEEGLQASKARKRLEFVLVARSMDGVIGRELPRIGTTADRRKPGSPLQADSGASPSLAEHAMLEAAIQLDVITPEQAAALIDKSKTLGEWLVEQEEGKVGKPEDGGQRKLDALGLLALLLFNLVVLAGIGWIVLRVLRLL
jgi:hypothetical protein